MDRYTEWWDRFSYENKKAIWDKLHRNGINIALKTINKEKEKFVISVYPNFGSTRTYIDFDAIEIMDEDDAAELILTTIEEIVEDKEILFDNKQRLKNKIKMKKSKIEKLQEINKKYVEHKAEHDNLYVTESDTLFLEFMEVTIDELKDLSDKLAELDRYHSNLDITVQEHDDKINEMYVEKER